MKKLLVSMVALLAMTSVTMAGAGAFSWGPAAGDAGTSVVITLGGVADSEVDAMSLAIEVAAPLDIIAIDGIGAGLYFNASNDTGTPIWKDGQVAGYDVTNPSTSVHLPVLNGALARITVAIPAGTAPGPYMITTNAYDHTYGSALGFGGSSLDMAQADGVIVVTPEPVTALLLLGALPLLRRRRA